MTEIPEHLRKRAEAARAKAQGESAARAERATADRARRSVDSVPIPAHLLARAQAARGKASAVRVDPEFSGSPSPLSPQLPDHLRSRSERPSRPRAVGLYFVGRNQKEALAGLGYADAGDAMNRRDELNPGGLGFQPYKIYATDVGVQEDDLFEW